MSQEMNDYLREIERNIRLNDAKNEGIQQGILKNKREIVIELNKKNMDLEMIAEVTKLSLDEVKKIIEESK